MGGGKGKPGPSLTFEVIEGPSNLVGKFGWFLPSVSLDEGVLVQPFGRDYLGFFLGRFEGLDLVSRAHMVASFDFDNGDVMMTDAGSKNGTKPEGIYLHRIGDRQTVRVADTISLEFRSW